ncbi:DNA helicase B isoform X3 [Narcine bancroftii]|uniref:DNA helicase B isoform X2 n=1 Tax=Narcine bancroftii TaxID=1343680 RepID=UPI0038311D60
MKIKDLRTGETYKVFGHFHFTSPWWKVTIKIYCRQNKWYLQWYPSYSLVHLGQKQISIISLFLTKCDVNPIHIKEFIEYLSRDDLEFSKVLSILQQIADEEKNENKDGFAKSIVTCISNSVEGQNVQQALKFQSLMKYLPQLLPRYFLRILKLNNTILQNLDQMIQTEMWKLGFNSILSKEVQLIGCEASLLAFEESDLLRTIPEIQKHALIIYDKLKRTCYRNGHTYVNIKELTGLRPSEFSVEIEWESLKFLKESKVIVIKMNRVYLECFYKYENEIASCIKELVDKPPWRISVPVEAVLSKACNPTKTEYSTEDKGVDDAQHNESFNLDQDQIKAGNMMCENPITIISGKGGCGKTTVISLIFKAVVENNEMAENEEILQACEDLEHDQSAPGTWDIPIAKTSNDAAGTEKLKISKGIVLFTAPTGKAASILRKKTGFAAYTLHQVIWNFHYTKYSKEKKVFDWMFSEVQVLIVDEGSLVSVKILSTILNLLMNYANLKKLVILGDIRQLPSIEPGNMFKDMYSSLYQVGWAIELSTNHRAESRLIVDNSTKIAEMGLKSTYITLEYDAVIYLSKGIETSIPESDKKFILVSFESSSYGLQEAISLLLKWAPGLDKHETSQFIAFRRQDCAEINELCCKQYSKHLTRDHKKKLDFRVGDKVCCTRNGYVVNFIEDPNEKSGMDLDKKRVRLYNGDIFFIIEDKTEYGNFITSPTRQLKLDDRENRQILVNYEEIRKECKLVHAWARTIHTFQGSEADTVVYVVGSAGGQNWQHIYTAVTRGRQRVYVVTSEDQFIAAVTARSPRRNTRLRELLQEKLVKLGPAKCFEGLQTQQHTSCVTCTLTAPSTSLFDSSVSSSTVLPHLSSSVANGINVGTNTPSQKEDTYSEDLAFAQNYSWSPYSLELDSNESIGANERSTETVNSLRQIGDGFMSDTSAGTTGSKRIKAIWSPGSKRSVNIQADDELVPKYSKLLESPLGSTKFMMMSLASSSPSREINKRLFKEKSELGFTQEQEQHQSWNEDIS